MINRPYWLSRLEAAWREAPIAWLCGVRRSGKTTLARSLGEDRTLYVNCDLPVAEEIVRDPAVFFRSAGSAVVVFDEIHQLKDPTRVLKVGADLFPKVRILATGSSTLAASRKFRDTLTGRKRSVHLLPVGWDELDAFGATLQKRLFHGGLPQALLADEKSPSFYREWLDSFFARDVQQHFGFRDVNRFNALLEYVLRQSGGQLEVSRAASALGVARQTVQSHLDALAVTNAVTLVRPYHGGGPGEIVRMPKAYAFDTGFVSFARGWDPLRPEDLGLLWEHLVLERLQARCPEQTVAYWRDKRGNEVDFVLARRRDEVDVVECKWNPASFEPAGLRAFRRLHPGGRNFLVTPSGVPAYTRDYGGIDVRVCTPDGLPSP